MRIDIHILADPCLVPAAPFPRRMAANLVEGTGKVMDRFKPYPIRDFLEGIVGVFNQFLGLLDAVLQQIAPRRDIKYIPEVLTDMPIRFTNSVSDLLYIAIACVVILDKENRLLNDPIARNIVTCRSIQGNFLTRPIKAKTVDEQFTQKSAA
ncbi:MAG: hypothetical protein BGO25_00205 [Acidobacteriales bacterium 59-55]|nr:MAG: hypothetical protein BGO25_00205 [Acidobacteriales bacterium 59-55]